MSRRTPRVGGGKTNETPRPTRATPRSVRETPRNMTLSSRRTSPRWTSGNRLDKRRGLPHDQALAASAADGTTIAATILQSKGNPNSRRTSPRWLGGNRIDKERGLSHSASVGNVGNVGSGLPPSGSFTLTQGYQGLTGLTVLNLKPHDRILPTDRSVQSTSRSDAMRVMIGIDPKDDTVKHTSYDPLAWYAPTLSRVAPNKTVFLDHNEAARLKKHKTRSDLLRTIKKGTLPHHTYDIDGDGIVNQSDLKVAREVDPQGKGVLDKEGTMQGKRRLAKKYLDYNHKERWFKHIAPNIHAMSKEEAVEHIANQPAFERTMSALRLKERPGNGTGGRGSRAALVEVDHGWASTVEERGPKVPTMVPTARRFSGAGQEQGKGLEQNSLSLRPCRSQSELFNTRKAQAIRENQQRFEVEPTSQDFRRLDLITVPKAWTRCENTSKSFLRHMYEQKKVLTATHSTGVPSAAVLPSSQH